MTLCAAIGGGWGDGSFADFYFILLERCAFILDVTAEYEYENAKRAAESDGVVVFMRIRHNVFTSLAADCTVYYVGGLYSTACVGCQTI